MKNESLLETEDFYRKCIRNLLDGLEVIDFEYFMDFRLSPENCFKLGVTYREAFEAKLKSSQIAAKS